MHEASAERMRPSRAVFREPSCALAENNSAGPRRCARGLDRRVTYFLDCGPAGVSDGLRDGGCDFFRWLMLPETQRYPARSAQCLLGVTIAETIPLDLGRPICLIGLWQLEMRRASMPVASINEDGNACRTEYKVCGPWQRADWSGVYPVPKSASMNQPANREFRLVSRDRLDCMMVRTALLEDQRPLVGGFAVKLTTVR